MPRPGSLASPGIWNLMKLPSMTRWSRPDPAIDGEATSNLPVTSQPNCSNVIRIYAKSEGECAKISP